MTVGLSLGLARRRRPTRRAIPTALIDGRVIDQGRWYYSENILTVKPTRTALGEGLRSLVALAEDDAARARHRAADHILRDWAQALAPTVDRLAAHVAPLIAV